MKDIEILIEALRTMTDDMNLSTDEGKQAQGLLDNLIACEQNVASDRVTGEFNRAGEFIRLCR